ncbi:MAG: hypothetical protein EAX90_13795 [Candidatus Heimdallarchaeota archaeon]|nr:hypothetical protein [Candidatus Heimdallarchaeota archaeon]HUU77857.1 hypothetical protein [candidate division Zixibacteria bacterium]
MIPEDVRKSEMLIAQKRTLRAKAEDRKNLAYEKMKIGDFTGAKQALMDARQYIQEALKKVRVLGERGLSERTIQDDIETLWRKIILSEKEK